MAKALATGNQLTARFGRRLRAWRNCRHLPLKHVAADLGVSVQVISDWERGVRFPCEKHLAQLESYTGLPLCTFFCPDDEGCRWSGAEIGHQVAHSAHCGISSPDCPTPDRRDLIASA